jgi:hypothetical protein
MKPSIKPWEMTTKPRPAARNVVSVTTKTAGVMTNQTAVIRIVLLVFVAGVFDNTKGDWVWQYPSK